MGEVKLCGSCYSGSLAEVLDMGLQPLAEGNGSKRYPLRLVQCASCGLVQLSHVVDPGELFPPEHPYSTGNSAALLRHYQDLARDIAGNLMTEDVVVDIGANDGTLLKCYPPGRGNLVKVAVEPTDQLRKCLDDEGITGYKAFFTAALGREIRRNLGAAKAVTACNVLAHVPDPHDFLEGVYDLLADDGVFITENHDYASVADGLQVDTVYHEHLRYYTPGTLAFLLERHGLRVTNVVQTRMHGGSFRTYARKASTDFPARARFAATALRALLYQLKNQQKNTIYGVGAATRATPLIHYAGIAEFLTCVCEVPGSDKIGHLMPGTQVRVIDERALWEEQPEYALLFAWHMADIIVPKLRAAGYTGRIIVPLPEPKILDY